jgi:hypothetical protein
VPCKELAAAGFDRSYPTLVRELRRLELRPVCLVYQQRRGRAPTIEIDHPPGEQIQLDRLELPDKPWASRPMRSSARCGSGSASEGGRRSTPSARTPGKRN